MEERKIGISGKGLMNEGLKTFVNIEEKKEKNAEIQHIHLFTIFSTQSKTINFHN